MIMTGKVKVKLPVPSSVAEEEQVVELPLYVGRGRFHYPTLRRGCLLQHG